MTEPNTTGVYISLEELAALRHKARASVSYRANR
jgi:hypothetical protein